MIIETSLIRLDEAVNEGQKLSAGAKVVLPIGDDAEIYGFIAIDGNMLSPNIDMPPLGECKVFSNRVIFYLDKHLHRFPIFQSVCKATKEKYALYLLYVSKFFYLSSEWEKKCYIDSMCKDCPNPNVSRIDGIQIEDNIAYYLPNEYDLYFESRSKLRAIGTGFVIVTRRISKLSGDIKYEVFDSHSVKMERI